MQVRTTLLVPRPPRSWFAAPALVLLLACSGGGSNASPTTQPPIRAGNAALAPGLLTADELLKAGLPKDARTSNMTDMSVFLDPDPRGPCGAKVPALDVSGGAAEGIQATALNGVDVVVRDDEALLRNYLDQRSADAHAGCADFQSKTDRGAQQTVHLDGIIPLPPLPADQALAVQQTINAQTRVTVLHVRKGSVIARLTIFAKTPPPAPVIAALATEIATHLATL